MNFIFYEKTKINKNIESDVFSNCLTEIKDYDDYCESNYFNPDFAFRMTLNDIDDDEKLTSEEKILEKEKIRIWFQKHTSDDEVKYSKFWVCVFFCEEDKTAVVMQESDDRKLLRLGNWLSRQYPGHAFESWGGDDSVGMYVPEAVLNLDDEKLISLFSEDHFIRLNNKVFLDADQVFFKNYVRDHTSSEDESDSTRNLLKSIRQDSYKFDL